MPISLRSSPLSLPTLLARRGLAATLILLLSALLGSSTFISQCLVAVNAPGDGEDVMAGAATLIRWSGVGGCLHGVKIELYHRGFRLLAIENRTRVAAGTAHVWRVPWTLLVATSSERDYVVVVSSHDYDRAGGTGARGSSSPTIRPRLADRRIQ